MNYSNPEYQYGHFTKIIKEFRALWKHYLIQSFLAAIVTLIIFSLLSVGDIIIVASIGSTAFIVFTMPTYVTAKPRRVIGGHITGLLCGVLGAFVVQHSIITPVVVYSAIVGLSIFLMVALDFEHPPASGTALGVAVSGFSFKILVAILVSTIILSLTHHYMKKHLKDLI